MSAEGSVSRRALLRGAGGAAGAAAVAAASKRSTVFAAPAVVRQTGSKVKVLYWGSYSGLNGDTEQEIVRRFNESQSEVEVEYEYQGGYGDTANKLTAALQARQAPDVCLLDGVWWFKFVVGDALAPMNDFIVANDVDIDDYVDSLYIEGVRDGQTYWMPFARSTPIFYYNRDVWAEAGLPDRGPETWTEFLEWVPDLTIAEGDTVTRAAFGHETGGTLGWIFQCIIWQFGGKISDPDFTVRINEAPGVEAAEFYRSSTRDGWAMVSPGVTQDFIAGVAASMIDSTGAMARIAESADFEFGTAFLPEMTQFGCCTGGAGLSILSGSPQEKQEAAFKFVSFVSSPEITTYWAQTTGYMPVRKSAIASPEMEAFFAERPTYKTAVDQLPLTQPQDASAVLLPNGEAITSRGMERIIINFEDPQEVLDEVAEELTAEAEPLLEQIEAMSSQ